MTPLEFTYSAYKHLIELLSSKGYVYTSYYDWPYYEKCVIMRHDIDNDIAKALEFAKMEKELGVKSTYFVLLTSDLYNPFSLYSSNMLKGIIDCGHEVGLHFDECRYANEESSICERIVNEAKMLENIIERPVKTVSMHRPSKKTLENDLKIPGLINSYDQVFFKEFKYLSDSRRRWREPVIDIVESEISNRLHILTHAFWYYHEEKPIKETLLDFVNRANGERYTTMKNNMTYFEDILSEGEVFHE